MATQTDLDSVLSRVLLRLGNHEGIFSIFFRLKVEQKATFSGYEDLLEEVLFHLLSRAIKSAAASSSKKVKVLLRHNPRRSSVLLLVEDSGNGFPGPHTPKVFSFHDAGQTASLRAGLYVAKYYVQLMNGRMGYKIKQGVGGTVFKVQVPCPPDRPDPLAD